MVFVCVCPVNLLGLQESSPKAESFTEDKFHSRLQWNGPFLCTRQE